MNNEDYADHLHSKNKQTNKTKKDSLAPFFLKIQLKLLLEFYCYMWIFLFSFFLNTGAFKHCKQNKSLCVCGTLCNVCMFSLMFEEIKQAQRSEYCICTCFPHLSWISQLFLILYFLVQTILSVNFKKLSSQTTDAGKCFRSSTI